jgi:hypothetical protein
MPHMRICAFQLQGNDGFDTALWGGYNRIYYIDFIQISDLCAIASTPDLLERASMRIPKRLGAILVRMTAAGLLLAAGMLSGCTPNNVTEDRTMTPQPTRSLSDTIRSIDASQPTRIETATLALG